jgi:succinyl-diaminopimelate desuccinylase
MYLQHQKKQNKYEKINLNIFVDFRQQKSYTPIYRKLSTATNMKEELLPLAKKLIEIPSVSGDLTNLLQALKLAKEQLTDFAVLPFVSNNIPSLLYTNQQQYPKKFKILFNAHLDVVPAKKDQFIPFEENGKLYGRGAYDMKAAAAVMIVLFKELAPKLSYPFGLQIVTDEEPGGYDGAKYQVEQGVRSEFVITGESTNFRIINEAKTRVTIKLTAAGKASHSAYPWLGDNAIWKLQQVIHRIFELYPMPTQETNATTINVTQFSTQNDAYNRTPFHAEAVLDIRYVNEDKEILKYVQALLPEDIKMEILLQFDRHLTDPNSPYIQRLQEAANKLGMQVPLALAHGTSDMPYFSAVGCEAIEFGLRGGGHHGLGEWVDIESIFQYYEVLKAFLLDIEKEIQGSDTHPVTPSH